MLKDFLPTIIGALFGIAGGRIARHVDGRNFGPTVWALVLGAALLLFYRTL